MSEIFCVQDRTGTAAQLTIEAETTEIIDIGDTGTYTGRDWQGKSIALDFTVGAVNDLLNFCITTMTPTGASGDVTKSNWPKTGVITWLTGENSASSPDSTVVLKRHAANAYIDPFYFLEYHASRGILIPESPLDTIRHSIVKGTDFLNQKYRYKGVKLLQYFGNHNLDPALLFVDPWLSPFAFGGGVGLGGPHSMFSPASTSQYTEWPRQGVIDYSGDSVWGVPQVIKDACAEAAFREYSGTPLQPDYDPDLVSAGGIIVSRSDEVGPIKESRTYDTKLGIGFFPDIPQIRRMLGKAGILAAGGGRTIVR